MAVCWPEAVFTGRVTASARRIRAYGRHSAVGECPGAFGVDEVSAPDAAVEQAATGEQCRLRIRFGGVGDRVGQVRDGVTGCCQHPHPQTAHVELVTVRNWPPLEGHRVL